MLETILNLIEQKENFEYKEGNYTVKLVTISDGRKFIKINAGDNVYMKSEASKKEIIDFVKQKIG